MGDGHDLSGAAVLLREARHAVALTGAGVSTPSGIPDFRSPGSGLWESVDPMQVASIEGFLCRPDLFYSWVRPLLDKMLAARPNPGHLALAEMEAAGWLKGVITQNIDDLHQQAGSREVLELHGHLREALCTSCGQIVEGRVLVDGLLASEEVPACHTCGGVMRPAVVFYGEPLPGDVLEAAMEHVRRADLMLVVGSSLETAPASRLPALVHRQGGQLVVVNQGPTYVDPVACVVVRGDVADVLPHLARMCVEEQS